MQTKACPHCGATDIEALTATIKGATRQALRCTNCGAIAAKIVWGMRVGQNGAVTKAAASGLLDLERALRGWKDGEQAHAGENG